MSTSEIVLDMEPAEQSTTIKYKPGESVLCRVQAPEPGGYLVTLLPSGMEGFLPSQDPIEIGRVVPATFVCMSGARALMAYAFMIGTTERVQLSTLSDEENAFAVWADSYPRAVRLRRAIDLIVPPINAVDPMVVPATDVEGRNYFARLEAEAFNGCVRVVSQEQKSRAAALFYHGRAVAAIYSKKPMVDPYPIETALSLMLADLRVPDAEMITYDLPNDVVLSMSALFLGCLVKRNDNMPNQAYIEQMLRQLADRGETACLSLHQDTAPRCLALVCNGKFLGTYSIIDRKFFGDDDRSNLNRLLEQEQTSKLEAYILPPVMMSKSVKFGFSLSSEQFAGHLR